MAPTNAQERCPDCGNVQPAGKEICEKCGNYALVADVNVADAKDTHKTERDGSQVPLKGGEKAKPTPKKRETSMQAAEAPPEPKPEPKKKSKDKDEE